jgi:hypothetical protein
VDAEVPQRCKVLCGLPNVFRYGDALVRQEYEEALEAIDVCEGTQNAVVVVGHPGIGVVLTFYLKRRTHLTLSCSGKTIFLYYVLVLRLLSRSPTLFQYENESIVFFNEDGVTRLSPKSMLRPSSATWALVDANPSVLQPAAMLLRDGAPFFTIVASSPRSAKWDQLAHYKPPFTLWFMKPFTLGELVEAYVSWM